MYMPSPYQILQPPGYVVMLFERMSWRIIPLDGRAHIPDNVRLWQGDSVGHWEGDTLVVDTTNLNGKTWLNESGRRGELRRNTSWSDSFRPTTERSRTGPPSRTPIAYTAAVDDRDSAAATGESDELLEVACHEDNGDLQHLEGRPR